MKKIKILRIIARLNIGGPAIHSVLLTEGLDCSKFESVLVCGSLSEGEANMSYYAQAKGVSPRIVKELGRELNFWNDLVALTKIYGIIKKEKPDIIHTHTAKAGSLGRLAGLIYNMNVLRKKKVKLAHTFHGHALSGYFGSFANRMFTFIERFLAYFSDVVITVSESVKKELLELKICGQDKIKVIPLGFELDKLLALKQREPDIVNIGIVGRLVPIKNHRLFFDAATLLIKDFHNVRFKVIGDGQLRQELEAYCLDLGLSKYVDFLGWKRGLEDIYSDLDVVALTSINEGTPVSLIEAMAGARPVVATDVGGVRDLVGPDRGFVVKAQDSATFADKLRLLARDSALRKQMGLCGRDFVKNTFSKQRLIKDMETLYLTMV